MLPANPVWLITNERRTHHHRLAQSNPYSLQRQREQLLIRRDELLVPSVRHG